MVYLRVHFSLCLVLVYQLTVIALPGKETWTCSVVLTIKIFNFPLKRFNELSQELIPKLWWSGPLTMKSFCPATITWILKPLQTVQTRQYRTKTDDVLFFILNARVNLNKQILIRNQGSYVASHRVLNANKFISLLGLRLWNSTVSAQISSLVSIRNRLNNSKRYLCISLFANSTLKTKFSKYYFHEKRKNWGFKTSFQLNTSIFAR